jgi:DNA-directed RNA polymerase subunit E'/Rpb7
MIQLITQEVSIESRYLDSDVKYHILDKLKKTMEGKCTFDSGYIIIVKKVTSLGENKIGCANSLVIFEVTYEAEILKPEKGQHMSGKVCMIFQHGIFVDVCGKMKVLIPLASMKEYTYSSDENSFESACNTIVNGVEVEIEIVMTKYEKKHFSCIGKLLHVSDTESDDSE